MNIILAHGILGFGKLFGVIEYFRGVKEALEGDGARVLVSVVSATGSIRDRGDRLAEEIAKAFASGELLPGEKAHILAHSMGGLDSRYVLSPANQNNIADRIASLTTIGTPHLGSLIADLVALKEQDRGLLGKIEALALRFVFLLPALELFLKTFSISLDGLRDLTTEACRKFNDETPLNKGVNYRYVAGVGRPSEPHTNKYFAEFYKYILAHTGQVSDGLVHLESARFGDKPVIQWPCDHVDEVGYNLDNLPATGVFDHITAYRELVKELKS